MKINIHKRKTKITTQTIIYYTNNNINNNNNNNNNNTEINPDQIILQITHTRLKL